MEESKISLKKCSSLSNLQVQNNPQPMSPTPPLSSPVHSRDQLTLSLITPRTRRFSCNSSNGNAPSGVVSPGPRLAPRVSQLRQEESLDVQNREVTHEREIHSALSISQSYEDLTLVMSENWNFKNNHDDFSNPLHVSLPGNAVACSSPSPTSRHLRLQYGMSPSPTRRSFATRRSMSPIAIRPSPLGSVKRKFEMVDEGSCSSTSSQPAYKKIFTENFSRGSSPIMSPLPICPSPDSSNQSSCENNGGRSTPKMFIAKIFNHSTTSSPLSSISLLENDSPSPSAAASSSSSKDLQDNMEVGSTSGDSGVDASSDVGSSTSEMLSDIGGGGAKESSEDKPSSSTAASEMEVIIESSTSSSSSSNCIVPMTIDKEQL